MVIGFVNSHLEVIVPLVIADADGQEHKIECQLATGFLGDLFMPPTQVDALKLPQTGTGQVGYPPGSPAEAPVHQAHVLWCGQKHTISVFAYGQHPVLGLGLLQGYRLNLQMTEGQQVIVGRL